MELGVNSPQTEGTTLMATKTELKTVLDILAIPYGKRDTKDVLLATLQGAFEPPAEAEAGPEPPGRTFDFKRRGEITGVVFGESPDGNHTLQIVRNGGAPDFEDYEGISSEAQAYCDICLEAGKLLHAEARRSGL
jgi:hypothetical protein